MSLSQINLFPGYQQGRKHTYKIELHPWQESLVQRYPKHFWRGLFHTDGSRYFVSKQNLYNYSFVQKSDDIMNLFLNCCKQLGIKSTCYFHKSGGLTKDGLIKTSLVWATSKQNEVKFLDTFAGPKS